MQLQQHKSKQITLISIEGPSPQGFSPDLNRQNLTMGPVSKQIWAQGKPTPRLVLQHIVCFEYVSDILRKFLAVVLSKQCLPPRKVRQGLTIHGRQAVRLRILAAKLAETPMDISHSLISIYSLFLYGFVVEPGLY